MANFRRLTAGFRDARLRSPRSRSIYFPSSAPVGPRRACVLGREPGAHAGDRVDRRAHRLPPLPRPVLRARPAAVPDFDTYQQATAAADQIDELMATPTTPRRPGTRRPPRAARGAIVFEASTSATRARSPRPCAGVDLDIAARRVGRPGRRDRRGQVHHRQAHRPLLRPHRRAGPGRRPRSRVDLSAYRRQLGIVPQEAFLFAGHHPRQHRLRAPRGDRRRGRGGGAGRRGPRLHRRAARWLPPRGHRAGPLALDRPAPAHRPGPGPAGRTRPSCCSTRPPPTSTSRPRPG